MTSEPTATLPKLDLRRRPFSESPSSRPSDATQQARAHMRLFLTREERLLA
jgi:hypothetical protein